MAGISCVTRMINCLAIYILEFIDSSRRAIKRRASMRRAISSWSRFGLSGDRKDHDLAIAFQRAALDLCTPDSSDRALALFDLAFLLDERYKRWGDASDLESAITMNRTALDMRPDGHPDRSMSLNNTANCLLRRYEREGSMSDLEEAIVLYRVTLDLTPNGRSDRPMPLNNIAICLLTRYKCTGRMPDLDEAITLHRAALDLTHEGHPDRSAFLDNTANCLLMRYKCEGRVADLEEAISLHRDALDLIPDGHVDRSASLSNTANCLGTRYRREGRMPDLEEAISLHRAALDLRPYGHPDRSTSLNNTASCLEVRYQCSGRMSDLEEAISLHRAALDLISDGHPERSVSLNNTANCLLTRYECEGEMPDLEEAISLYRAALDLLPDGHSDKFSSLNNTANCLWTRYKREGRISDLDEAISLHRAALDLISDGHPDRSASLDNTALCLLRRYVHSGGVADLEEAISLHRAALDLRPDSHPGRPMSLDSTAICLLIRYELEGRIADLEEAISLHRAALDLRPNGHPDRSMSLNNTATCLLIRYEREGGSAVLNEAISLHRAALDLIPEGHPDRSASLNNIANCLLMRYVLEAKPNDLDEAIQFLRCSAVHAFSSFSSRFHAARRWVRIARSYGRHETLVEGYRCAMSVLQSALATRPSLSEQHKLLSGNHDFGTFAMDAASFAIDNGDLDQAVEVLEQGRALLWSQMRGFRTPLEQLSQVNKSLSERFENCSRRLETLISSSESTTGGLGIKRESNQVFDVSRENRSVEQLLTRMRQLHEEQEIIANEIRCINGFEGFLQATPFAVLRQAAWEGPVVVLNHSRFRCDALIILLREDDPCICVPLDEKFHSDSIQLHEELLRIRRELKVHTRQYDEVLRRVMKFLWERVVSKVVQKLRELGVTEGSWIWWCPTSVLTAFPFHAAGPYEGENGKLKYLLDDYISSYTPTLTSLINSRYGTSDGSRRMLFVADTKLPSAKKERMEILRNRRIDVQLRDKHATSEAVLRELQTSSWVHFVCHGTLDEEPFNSRLNISGEGLKLLDIARANLPNAEFAFLSACHTAEQGPKYALDEALHLAAGMQFCGFKSVVGTMWQVLDRDGPFISGKFYGFLKYEVQEGEMAHKRAAAAVRDASLRLRERVKEEVVEDEANTRVERWVNVVHIGA